MSLFSLKENILALCGLAVMLALFAGWCMNIYHLAHMDSAMSGLGVLRIIGIFAAPLGGVLGFVGA